MSTGIEITGLVLHFRTPGRTLACLRSLLAESIYRVILVDNSEDGGQSLAVMQQNLGELRDGGLETQIVQPEHNLGFAAGVIAGLKILVHRDPTHVLLINSDAILQPGAVSRMVKVLSSSNLVVPRVRTEDASATLPLVAYYQRLFALYFRRPHWGVLSYPSGCCLLIGCNQLRLDLFDTDFFFYGEDVAFGHNLRRRGIYFVECPEATVVHAGSVSSGNGSLFYEYHMVRAHWLLARKLADSRFERLAFILMRCITLPLRAAVRSVRFCSLVPWGGLLAATADVLRGRMRSLMPPAEH